MYFWLIRTIKNTSQWIKNKNTTINKDFFLSLIVKVLDLMMSLYNRLLDHNVSRILKSNPTGRTYRCEKFCQVASRRFVVFLGYPAFWTQCKLNSENHLKKISDWNWSKDFYPYKNYLVISDEIFGLVMIVW